MKPIRVNQCSLLLWLALVSVSLLLPGCGFHLRGNQPNQHFGKLTRIHLESSDPYGFLTKQFKRSLRDANVELVDAPEQAPLTIQLRNIHYQKTNLSITNNQRSASFRFIYQVTLSVFTRQQQILIHNQPLLATRIETIDASDYNHSNSEQLIKQALLDNLVFQLNARIHSQQLFNALNAHENHAK